MNGNLVAGATGVSPYISYLQKQLDDNEIPDRQIHLVYGLRKIDHLLYFEKLTAGGQTMEFDSIQELLYKNTPL